MRQYKDLLAQTLMDGVTTEDRTGVGTIRVFGTQTRYDLQNGFPLVTTKKVFWKAVVGELLWFLRGSTNRNLLESMTHGTIGEKSTIWDEWANEDGELGPVYGKQWRDFGGVDQIYELVEQIKTNPTSRRLIVNAWNAPEIADMALPPCHTMFQVLIIGDKLHLQLYQRSADLFLGVPFNIASYALLMHLLAHVTGYEVGEFIHTTGDTHIYLNHLRQVDEQLKRAPLPLPTIRLNPEIKSIFEFRPEDIELVGYQSHGTIKAPVAV